MKWQKRCPYCKELRSMIWDFSFWLHEKKWCDECVALEREVNRTLRIEERELEDLRDEEERQKRFYKMRDALHKEEKEK